MGGVVIGAGLGLEAANWAGVLVATGGVLLTVLAVALDRRAGAVRLAARPKQEGEQSRAKDAVSSLVARLYPSCRLSPQRLRHLALRHERGHPGRDRDRVARLCEATP